jgi:hypothetical protein
MTRPQREVILSMLNTDPDKPVVISRQDRLVLQAMIDSDDRSGIVRQKCGHCGADYFCPAHEAGTVAGSLCWSCLITWSKTHTA